MGFRLFSDLQEWGTGSLPGAQHLHGPTGISQERGHEYAECSFSHVGLAQKGMQSMQ